MLWVLFFTKLNAVPDNNIKIKVTTIENIKLNFTPTLDIWFAQVDTYSILSWTSHFWTERLVWYIPCLCDKVESHNRQECYHSGLQLFAGLINVI